MLAYQPLAAKTTLGEIYVQISFCLFKEIVVSIKLGSCWRFVVEACIAFDKIIDQAKT